MTALASVGVDVSLHTRIDHLDWPRIESDLDARGNALVEGLIEPERCAQLAALYADDSHFRSRVVMARHGYGRGEYRYFRYQWRRCAVRSIRISRRSRIVGMRRWRPSRSIR